MMLHLRHKILGAVAAAAVAAALSAPAMAAEAAAPASTQASAPSPMKGRQDPVEAQIARLRGQLHITDAQNEKFNAVAQVMRDNRNAHDALVKEKRQSEKTETAVEDLQAYAQIAQNHADGVKKMAVAFEDLYSVLSDDQKKAADEAFRQHKRRVMGHMGHVMQKAQ